MSLHFEKHKVSTIGFLRAAVLGANDGLISNSSLIIGVTYAGLSDNEILKTSIAALIAGAMSMAAGEYVSVSSQSDTEKADLKKEISELLKDPESELLELENIYIGRGLSKELATKVALELTVKAPI
jgi:vacuolar iron transporter family protein